jgi:hypothetical protein
MGRAGDLMIRVKFDANDRLSRFLDRIRGKSNQAGRALIEMNRSIGAQKGELRDVQRELTKAGGNITVLVDRETALKNAIASATREFEKQEKVVQNNERTRRRAVMGGEIMAAGKHGLFETAALAVPLFEIAKAGAEFQALQNRMRVLGLGDDAVKDLTAFAGAMNIAGSSVTENMRYLLEAQGVFRESGEHSLGDQLSGAKLMAPLLAKMHAVAQATGKELSEDQERYFLRFVEQAGGLASPKRAAELTDGLFRALQSSGGNVQAADYQSFMARAGIAGSHLTNRSMFADFEPLIGELHEQAGVGLATAFKQATGIKVNSRAAAEFMKLGLWDRHSVVLNKLGGVKTTKGNPLKAPAAEALQHDPVEFYRKFVLPAYQRAGIKTSEGRAFENAKIFGGTGGNLFNLIDKQLPTILRSREAFKKTQTLDQAYNQTSDSFFGQEGKLRTAAKDFLVAAGTKGGLLDNVTALMTSATGALKSFTAWGNAHPTAFAWIGWMVVKLVELKAVLALAQIGFGGLLGPLARIWGLWSKFRLVGSVAATFPTLAKAATTSFGAIRAAALFMGQGFLRAGVMMLANPMVLTIVAAVAAVALLSGAAYELYKHWGDVAAFFSRLWTGVKTAFAAGLAGIATNITYFAGFGLGSLVRFGEAAWGWLTGRLPGLLGDGLAFAWSALTGAFRALPALLVGAWHFAWSALTLSVRAAFLTLPALFADYGVMIVEGLWSGIKNAPSALWNAGKRLATSVADGFRAGAKIHSPSRVFAELGGFLTSGLAIGIDRGADHPVGRTNALVGRLAAAMALAGGGANAVYAEAPAAALRRPSELVRNSEAAIEASHVATRRDQARAEAVRPIAASPAAPMSVTFNIHPAPGMDERALADLIERKMQALQTGGATRQRSSFGDQPDVDTLL